jgi:hypothetical protein
MGNADVDALSRREFASVCAILAAALTACSDITTRTRTAAALIVDPAEGDYRGILRSLIETVLPIGSPYFPLDAATVHDRLLLMFPLEDETRFLGLQRTLVYFNDLDLAPHAAAPLIAAERLALDVPERMSERDFRILASTKIASDIALTRSFTGTAGTFIALPPPRRAAWLNAWRESAFTVKRQFAQAIRTLIHVSAYSDEVMWPAIRYAGPLVRR